MFGGYQNEKIVLVADTREELEGNKFVFFDKIEELSEDYKLYKGEYITAAEAEERKAADEKSAHIKELQEQLDVLDLKTIRALRAIGAGEGTAQDTEKLSELEAKAEEIRQQIRELQEN